MSRLNWNSLSGGKGPLRRETWEPDAHLRPGRDESVVHVIAGGKGRETEKERVRRLAAELKATLDYNDAIAREHALTPRAAVSIPSWDHESVKLLSRSRSLFKQLQRTANRSGRRRMPYPIDWRAAVSEIDRLERQCAKRPDDPKAAKAVEKLRAARQLVERLRIG